MEERMAVASGSSKGAAKGIAKGGSPAAAPAGVSKLSDHDAADYPRFSAGIGEVDRHSGDVAGAAGQAGA